MSIIVAVTNHMGTAIGSDGRATYDSGMIVNEAVAKIRHFPGAAYAIGTCGALGPAQKALGTIKPIEVEHRVLKYEGSMDDNVSAVVAMKNGKKSGQIWSLTPDGATVLHRSYLAIGAGDAFAMGALEMMVKHLDRSDQDPAYMVKKALETAVKFNNTCGGRLHIVKL